MTRREQAVTYRSDAYILYMPNLKHQSLILLFIPLYSGVLRYGYMRNSSGKLQEHHLPVWPFLDIIIPQLSSVPYLTAQLSKYPCMKLKIHFLSNIHPYVFGSKSITPLWNLRQIQASS